MKFVGKPSRQILLWIVSGLSRISGKSNFRQNYDEINKEIFGYNSGQHLFFYRVLIVKVIEITRILHSRMDLKNRIQE